ncbi:MAG: diguanylate cyclase [Traorella sp.]
MSEENKNYLFDEIKNLREVLDNLQTPFSISTLESNPRFIYVNDLMLELLGITRKQFDENEYRATDFYDEQDLKNLKNLDSNKVKIGDTKLLKYKMNAKNGRILYLHDISKVVAYNGKLFFQSVYYDKTIEHNQELKLHEQENLINQSQEIFVKAASSLMCGLIQFNNLKELKPVYVNSYAAHTFGFRTSRDFLNFKINSLNNFFTSDKIKILKESVSKTHTQEEHNPFDNFELSFLNNKNTLTWVVGYVNETQDVSGNTLYQFLFLDTTNIKQTEQKLKFANDKFKISCELAKVYLAEYNYLDSKISILNGNFIILKTNERNECTLNFEKIEDEYLPDIKKFFYNAMNQVEDYGVVLYKYKGDLEKWTELQYQIIKDEYKNPLCAIFVGKDATQVVKAKRYFDNEIKLRKVLTSNSLASLEIDLDEHELISKSGPLFDSCQTSINSFASLNNFFAGLVHPDDKELVMNAINDLKTSDFIQKDVTRSIEARILVAHKTYHYALFRLSIIVNPYDHHVHIFVIINDIDKKKKEELEIFEKANKDSLTELNNRSSFEVFAKSHINLLLSEKGKCAFFIIDIDDFKNVNDIHGHIQGDILLRKIASVLKEEIKPPHIVARLGGDEFVALFINVVNEEGVLKEANRICDKVKQISFQNYKITCSIGICISNHYLHKYDDLYLHADKALYKAKRDGKNKVVLYKENMDEDK